MAHPHWENPEVVGIGRLPARSYFKRYRTGADALAQKRPLEISLNGTWRFRRVASPAGVPPDWLECPVDSADWRDMQVPSLWTRSDTDDKPIYTNVRMPFKAEPPRVPPENPTGLYRRTFTLLKTFAGRRTVIQIGGVENCYYLYCNGSEVGFSKDARLPSEFDLTDYLIDGENELALKVLRWSDSSYIEDQDQWWHAGIHRDVTLYSTDAVYLRDIDCRPTYRLEKETGEITVDVRLGDTNRSSTGFRVEVDLLSPLGKPVLKAPVTTVMDKAGFLPVIGKGPVVQLTANAGRVKPWSAEAPNLYTLVVTLKAPNGKTVESTGLKIGFRHLEITEREFRINGAAVLIKGVNRHDHCDVTGKVMTEALMRADIETMKRHNINAVRTSHYPNDSRFYELCDEYGLYVVDECNIEAHHHYQQLGRDPAWATAFINRVVRMVERDKNHPSIIMWSMGNETGFGPHHAAMAAWVRQYDPTRPIHNESAICEQAVRDMWNENAHGTDVICPMYPSVADIINHATDSSDPRPLIMCEYAHAMGNSCGNLKEYWDAIENHQGLQGGFVWEWLDHGLKETANGIPYWAYGGDFGEDRHDLNFVCDGLCWPDRTPHSSLLEYKRVLQPVSVSRVRGQRFRIHNKNWFTTLAQYAISWELLLNGERVKAGKLKSLATAPQAAADVDVAFSAPTLAAGDELSIVFTVSLAKDESWAPRGEIIAESQIALAARAHKAKRGHANPLRVETRGPARLTITDAGDTIRFEEDRLHWQRRGDDVISSGPVLNVWRAPLDNDGIKGWEGQDNKPLGRWRRLGIETITCTDSQLSYSEGKKGGVIVTIDQLFKAAAGNIKVYTTYAIQSGCEMDIEHIFDIDETLADLPRIGVRMTLPPGYEALSWFGRGPHETYVDRKVSGTVRVHHSTVRDQYVPYILPQEHGNLTDIRWLELRKTGGANVHIAAPAPIEASASHYPHELLTPAFHTYEVTPDQKTFVTLDVMQRGLGGASCGPDTLPGYRTRPGKHRLAYRMSLSDPDRS